ncbi:MAG TPA: PqiC family protein [Steroidobacteraceae bacterium]|nr:PqiC family protein [Steroidobacteraceae bacterium]
MSGRTGVLVAVLAGLCACSSSPPSRVYTLSETAPDTAGAPGVGFVRIDRVTVPGEIDRPELVRRTGPNRLEIAGLDRWAAPLDDTIQRVLSDDVARRIPTPAPGQARAVQVDIREFYGDGACNVTLRAVWTVRQLHPDATPPNMEDIHVPSGGGPCPATLAATMSTALGQLSDRIVAGVARSGPVSEN